MGQNSIQNSLTINSHPWTSLYFFISSTTKVQFLKETTVLPRTFYKGLIFCSTLMLPLATDSIYFPINTKKTKKKNENRTRRAVASLLGRVFYKNWSVGNVMKTWAYWTERAGATWWIEKLFQSFLGCLSSFFLTVNFWSASSHLLLILCFCFPS